MTVFPFPPVRKLSMLGLQANPTLGPQLFLGAGIEGNVVTEVGKAGFHSGIFRSLTVSSWKRFAG
jgi:hypothetical protein